jgi:hypothetical protein
MPLASVDAFQLTRICDDDCATAVTLPGTLGGVLSAGGAGVVALTAVVAAETLAAGEASTAISVYEYWVDAARPVSR